MRHSTGCLLKKTTDAQGNVIQINSFNYRVLHPFIMQDVNDNNTAVRFNELGFVTGTFLIGKKGVDAGDELDETSVESSPNRFSRRHTGISCK